MAPKAKKSIPNKKSLPQSPPKRRYAPPALEKGLDILELFAIESDALSKSDVARRLNRTHSEVFRMMVCLEERGYIYQGEDEKYRSTLKLFELSQHHPPTKRMLRESFSILQDIANRTSQSCHLSFVYGGAVTVISQVDPPSSTSFAVKAGTEIDLMRTSSGYVALAFQNFEVCNRMVEQYRLRGGTVPDDLASHLERIREQGGEVRPSYTLTAIINITFPVIDTHGNAIACLTVPYLEHLAGDAPGLNFVVETVRAGAKLLSMAFGGRNKS